MAAPKKKPQAVAAAMGLSKEHTPKFTGTDNPRHLRVLAALLRGPRPREALDAIAGCSNTPDLIADLRERELGKEHLPCERIEAVDRDGKVCRPGVYSLTEKGRRMIRAWLSGRPKPGAEGC